MSEWQPIETAPKDGTKVLLWQAGNPSGEWPFMASWETSRSHPNGGIWAIYIEGQALRDPTHWMPIQEPPE